ncbi:pectinesterase-like isoform X1 [Papaver somniferum]|uniref:pectinesterase-like isoform X1 n=1 Tax=Papaver somniferum TaxID=3469 RepID=UPI000E6FA38A|nr:pectinesterase-like isoform X1 [Papaver somniferum]
MPIQHKKNNLAMISASWMVLVFVIAAHVDAIRGVDIIDGVLNTTKNVIGAVPLFNATNKPIGPIPAICKLMKFEQACIDTLNKAEPRHVNDPKELIKIGFQSNLVQLHGSLSFSGGLLRREREPRAKLALHSCQELMDYAIDGINRCFEHINPLDIFKICDVVKDLQVWLSAALTYQDTCLDGFESSNSNSGVSMKGSLKSTMELTNNGLSMVSELTKILGIFKIPFLHHGEEPESNSESEASTAQGFFTAGEPKSESESTSQEPKSESGSTSQESKSESESTSQGLFTAGDSKSESESESESTLPSWATAGQRKLLQSNSDSITPNVVVALDGSGKYKSVGDALQEVPMKNKKPFIIYVKEGLYNEWVNITKQMTNVMLIGDGATKTKITNNKGFTDGINTFSTATFSVVGDGFMAKDIGFENSAGAVKHQAVALRVSADMSIFYRVQIDGYQDTLYAHANRQFYRECTITGTIDFIFGAAMALFQNCKIIVRKPMENQSNMVLASGRKTKYDPAALVLQNCTITADPLLFPERFTLKSYLGRPWKEYARHIIMDSQIDDLIDPAGWHEWMGDFGLNTCFFAEVNNRGPGAALTKRVKWRGVKTGALPPEHFKQFTATSNVMKGGKFIMNSGVPYTAGM